MGLTSAYMQTTGRLPDLFKRIRDGQAPEQFTQQLLKDWGFASSNDRAALPLLKALGFLTSDGKPTPLYLDYRDHSRSAEIMAQAIRNTYSDLFLISEHPTESDKATIQGKFKSFHNATDLAANHMTRTFYALLGLADLKAKPGNPAKGAKEDKKEDKVNPSAGNQPDRNASQTFQLTGLHYNIQIHLPATKDVEVYNAIFKSLKEHLVDK